MRYLVHKHKIKDEDFETNNINHIFDIYSTPDRRAKFLRIMFFLPQVKVVIVNNRVEYNFKY